MEHGLDSPLSNVQLSNHMKNGVLSPIMANFPDGPVSQAKENKKSNEPVKVNGEGNQDFDDLQENPYEDSYSSESDALVIDESVPKKRKVRSKYIRKTKENIGNGREKPVNESSNPSELENKTITEKRANTELANEGFFGSALSNQTVSPDRTLNLPAYVLSEETQTSDNFSANSDLGQKTSETHADCDALRFTNDISSELLAHSNPFFRESLFELSQLHHGNNENSCQDTQNISDILPSINKTSKRIKVKPKFKEYAQYLGLQPAIQFKCPKCGKSGFESLLTLQEHFLHCNAIQSLEKSSGNENVSGFKLTRKVFLCSACGTYYENWNLYMHMLEYHKRYICLYCLGMFSILDDLCQHIQSRHNLEPGIKNTLEDFYNTYNEPCYVVCCECNQQFNEGDNFFYHNCAPTKPITKSKTKHIKQIIAPENHVTGDFGALPNDINEHPDSDKSISEPTPDVTDVKSGETENTDNIEKQPVINENLPESVNNEGSNVKQNCNDGELPKNFDSDSNESEDLSNYSERIIDTNEKRSDGLSESNMKEVNDDDTRETYQQDSPNSSKISNENMEVHQHDESIMDDIENFSGSGEKENTQDINLNEPVETRKVPKLSLKLPKLGLYPQPDLEDSDDSDKVDMEIDNIESENENDHIISDSGKPEEIAEEQHEKSPENLDAEEKTRSTSPQYPTAGFDIPVVEIELDQPLDKMDIRILLQKCLRATVSTCIYCNHSRRIAVNGKQLGLHAIAEHRYSAINKSITEEELIPDSFNIRIKECLGQLETIFFNLDSSASDEAVTFSHVFECFQCHYSTTVHKELYLHNRKFHSNNLLLCIMCKSNFYSYSELICHLCPGVYILDYDVHFRCCMCVNDDLPSSFRLMVHLRKRHNVCDVCLEMCHSQYKLSNHVWKHKLHHFCYRCGIAYRNKPDITRHLFWKHGTESVLCKKCLQKKWPHVYHFCVPPKSFACEECTLVFTRAVSLKVHKRLHTEEKKHACTWENCTESFISKKLMLKHLKIHTDPPEETKIESEIKDEVEDKEEAGGDQVKKEEISEVEEPPKSVKPKVDVYDLPELNLSESDSSDAESETEKSKIEVNLDNQHSSENSNEELKGNVLTVTSEGVFDNQTSIAESEALPDMSEHPPPPVDDTSSSVIQDIWDNFKNYQANKEKMDNMLIGEIDTKIDQPYIPDIPIPEVEEGITWQLALKDHDYCIDPEKSQAPDTIIEVKPSLESTESMDHDYCFQTEKDKNNFARPVIAVPPPPESSAQIENSSPRKRTSSSSSSSSGSGSSCACGSSCSCSDSSSGSSSSSSDSSNSDSSTEEGRKRQQQRRLKRKERNKATKKAAPPQVETESKVDVVSTLPQVAVDMPIRESDLETTESETDEEFYDREPQKFARKILEEKRAQLLAEMGPNMVPNGSFIESTSRPPTPPAGTIEEEEQPKRKKKTKKRKKRKNEKKLPVEDRTYSATLIMNSEPIAPPPSVPYYQQFHQTGNQSPTVAPITLSLSRNSPITTPQTPPASTPTTNIPTLARQESATSDINVRASKRRRVPNKFYGYSSDEEADKPQSLKRSKIEINRTIPAPPSPMLVPPITIKTVSSPLVASPRPPTVEPITLRLPKQHIQSSDYKSHRRPTIPPIRLVTPRPVIPLSKDDSATESNDSDLDEPPSQLPQILSEPPKAPQPQLYCYCRCPYDEVSEMIGCDSSDCQIEWFHFECVGIMVPPKGQWFCPDCRKKKQQQRNLN